jgi:hypothetical protein
MRLQVIALTAAVLLSPSAFASASCPRADANFGTFLKRFKNDAAFRESRLILPLQTSYSAPGEKSTQSLTLKQIRHRKMRIIRGDADARAMRNTEASLCESTPLVKRDHATFGQYSCGTDVYSSGYHFERRNGCWMLARITSSGG